MSMCVFMIMYAHEFVTIDAYAHRGQEKCPGTGIPNAYECREPNPGLP